MKKLSLAIAIMFAASLSTLASAEWKPPGPIKLMIAYAAGGGADTQARLIAEDITASRGWEFIPEQVTGKGGLNLAKALQDQPADGTVIGMVATESLGYNLRISDSGLSPENFTPLSTTASFQMGIVSRSDRGWKSFDDVIAAAKGGESLRFAAMSDRLADLAWLLGDANGFEFNIVSVKGGKAVLNGVNAGDMDLGFMAGIQAKGVASGDLVNLASGLSVPLQQSPDAKLMSDYGVSIAADGYFVFVAPAGLAPEVREALASAISDAINTDGNKSNGMIKNAFGAPTTITGEALDEILMDEWHDAGQLLAATAE